MCHVYLQNAKRRDIDMQTNKPYTILKERFFFKGYEEKKKNLNNSKGGTSTS